MNLHSSGVPDYPHRADLGLVVPPDLAGDVAAKFHYVSESLAGFRLLESRDAVVFRLKAGRDGDAVQVAGRMAEVAVKLCRAYRSWGDKVLVRRERKDFVSAGDPHPALEKAGEIFRYGSGRYGLGPTMAGLVELFDRQFLAAIRGFGAEARQFPSLVGADVLSRCRYIKAFPHSLALVHHLREDLEAIQNFAEGADWKGDHLAVAPGSEAAPECLLSPTVCFHCYSHLADTQLAGPRRITARGKCFRFESGNLQGLERLWDFSMRELIFVGPKEFVAEQRQRVIETCTVLLDQWELAYEIKTATDPFFIDDFSMQSSFQRAFDLKFEVRAALPYKEGGSLAIGSFNVHQDFFGRSFAISGPDGQPYHTGCVGFGLERVALALVAQRGWDPARWPAALRGAWDARPGGAG